MTQDEAASRGWHQLDVILVTGDAYIDAPSMGIAVVGRVLEAAGFRVGIIAQPDMDSPADISRLGEPLLFWGVSGGSVDSMVANYTASGKRRKSDDFTPGAENTRRPDRAVIAYVNVIRKCFKNTAPIVLGGIEASLRRVPHYDFWSNKIRRSILFDAKADYVVFGMADSSVVELAAALAGGQPVEEIRGLARIERTSEVRPDDVRLPSFEEVAAEPAAFARMFALFYANTDPLTGKRLLQAHGDRTLVVNPPPLSLSSQELDRIYELGYELAAHPLHLAEGAIRAMDTIRFSVTSHRGCYGECSFCAIAVHQGRWVQSRSAASIVREVERCAAHPLFKGTVHDVGGATANMYGIECDQKIARGACPHKRCLFPKICRHLPVDHGPQLSLLARLRQVPGVKKVVVASGIRHDMVLADGKSGERYLAEIVKHHVSGQMKLAPEHSSVRVLALMGKQPVTDLLRFKQLFETLTRRVGKEQYLTYYFIAAHPGCTEADMRELGHFVESQLGIRPEQVQIFTPTPSTWSTLMYWTGRDPASGEPIFVEKTVVGKERQKQCLTGPQGRKDDRLKDRKSGARPERKKRR